MRRFITLCRTLAAGVLLRLDPSPLLLRVVSLLTCGETVGVLRKNHVLFFMDKSVNFLNLHRVSVVFCRKQLVFSESCFAGNTQTDIFVTKIG
jgi:hypothetical protein